MIARTQLFFAAASIVIASIGNVHSQEDSTARDAAKLQPEELLQSISGEWIPKHAIGLKRFEESDDFADQFLHTLFTAQGLTIEGNLVAPIECKLRTSPAAITLDFSAPQFRHAKEHPPTNGQLIMLTTKDGQARFASFNLRDDSLTLRYPAGCCTRSGAVVTYERPPVKK